MLRDRFRWLIRNVSNILNIVGILTTLYLGMFYVPSWIRGEREARLRNAQSRLQQSLKELVFSDSTITIDEFNSLVRAAEIESGQNEPMSKDDIVVQVQQSFMEDKFLPLSTRRVLVQKLTTLKTVLTKESSVQRSPAQDSILDKLSHSVYQDLFSLIVSILSLLLAVLGVYSVYREHRDASEASEELANALQKEAVGEAIQDRVVEYEYEFETALREILEKYPGVTLTRRSHGVYDIGVDIVFTHSDKSYYVELKFLRQSRLGLPTIQRLKTYIVGKTGEAWLVYNTDITPMANAEVARHNASQLYMPIRLIHATSPEDFERQLPSLLAS